MPALAINDAAVARSAGAYPSITSQALRAAEATVEFGEACTVLDWARSRDHPDGLVSDAPRALVLLCHKLWCPFRAAQHGQRESVVARAATNLRRIVAIEFGTWRSGRNGGSSGLVTFA